MIEESFVERIKRESIINKFLKEDIIYQFIDFFKNNYKKMQYSTNIGDPLEKALQFYKYYNIDYYNIIVEGINCNNIIINDKVNKSFIDTETGKAFITLLGNDSDLFILVHEFAHFIDRNAKTPIIPNKYDFLCEVFSFYMEKQLECWLKDKRYNKLVEIRRNNRDYFEARMLSSIEYQLSCEKLYKETGNLKESSLDNTKIKSIMAYDYDLNIGLVNYLLRYPLANILSEYLLNNQIISRDYDLCETCLNTNLYDVLKKSKISKNK